MGVGADPPLAACCAYNKHTTEGAARFTDLAGFKKTSRKHALCGRAQLLRAPREDHAAIRGRLNRDGFSRFKPAQELLAVLNPERRGDQQGLEGRIGDADLPRPVPVDVGDDDVKARLTIAEPSVPPGKGLFRVEPARREEGAVKTGRDLPALRQPHGPRRDAGVRRRAGAVVDDDPALGDGDDDPVRAFQDVERGAGDPHAR